MVINLNLIIMAQLISVLLEHWKRELVIGLVLVY